MIRPDLFGRKKVLLIFGGLGHDDHEHDNLTPVDSTPVNCGEEKSLPKSGFKLMSLTSNPHSKPLGQNTFGCKLEEDRRRQTKPFAVSTTVYYYSSSNTS